MTELQRLKSKCQLLFNLYIRERDLTGDYFKCISCGEIKDKKYMDCGHFFNIGYYDSLRFDEDNAHGQCRHCNYFLRGNLIEYRKNLVFKIGIERFNLLETKAGFYKRTGHKFSRFDLLYRIEELKQKIKELKQ